MGCGFSNTKTTIAKSVTLSTGSLVFPSGVSLASSTSLYVSSSFSPSFPKNHRELTPFSPLHSTLQKILIVNAADPTYTYSSVGPFAINSFSSSSSSSPGTSPQVASPVLPIPIIPVTEGSPRSATQPGVSTATPAATTPLAISTVVASSGRMTSSGMVTSVISSSSSSSSSSASSSATRSSTATALNATSTPAAASASSANSVLSRGGTMLLVVMCASLLILS